MDTYHDTGCSKAPSCLKCPFDPCPKETERRGRKPKEEKVEKRNRQIFLLAAGGTPTLKLAQQYHLSRRQVNKVIHDLKARHN